MGHMVKFGRPECNLEEVGSPSRRSKTKTIRQSNSCEKLSEKKVQGGPKYYIMVKINKKLTAIQKSSRSRVLLLKKLFSSLCIYSVAIYLVTSKVHKKMN